MQFPGRLTTTPKLLEPAILKVAGIGLIGSVPLAVAVWMGNVVLAAALMAMMGMCAAFQMWSIRQLRTLYRNILTTDPRLGFLTDRQGRISLASPAARDRYSLQEKTEFGEILGQSLANPWSVMDEMLLGLDAQTTLSREIVTRKGHFRLRLTRAGSNRFLWWIEEDGAIPALPASKSQFPSFQLGVLGQLENPNSELVAFVGRRPERLEDFFYDLPLASGAVHRVMTTNGPIPAMIAIRASEAGKPAEVFLLPNVQRSDPLTSESRDWRAIENLPIPLMKLSDKGAILSMNREARRLLGCTAEIPQRVSDVLDGLGRPLKDWFAEVSLTRDGRSSQFLTGKREGSDLIVQMTVKVMDGGSSDVLIAVLNDVTELKALEGKFAQSQKMQAIGQLAGGVAHDFNNLLTAISGHCDLLLLRTDETQDAYADLIQIHQNANRAAALVGQLLAFSRQQTLQPETLDLRQIMSQLTHLLNRLVGEKITLNFTHERDLFAVWADKRQLEQVFVNLVVNARDAMEGRGEISLLTSNMTLHSPLYRDRACLPAGDYVLIKVVDQGTGIAPEKISKIFEPFFTTKKTGEGTGLGLSTVYGIVKQSGGFIFADSELGAGTTFSVFLPRAQKQEVRLSPRAPSAPAPLTPVRSGVVLLVEDEAPVRAFASRALRLRGFTVIEADSAEAALDILSDPELSVDVFISDVIMPGEDGPTWVRKALQDRPETPVIFVSGYPEDAFPDGQPDVNGAVFLAKPFSLAGLTDTVQQQLQSREAA